MLGRVGHRPIYLHGTTSDYQSQIKQGIAMEMHKQTIIKALCGGINSARERNVELRRDLLHATVDSPDYDNIEAQIEMYDDSIVEFTDALHWLNGVEYKEMQTIYKAKGDATE